MDWSECGPLAGNKNREWSCDCGGAVVTKDVEPYAVVGGVPARLIKYRFQKNEINILEEIKWWDWPVEEIERNIELFYQPEKLLKWKH